MTQRVERTNGILRQQTGRWHRRQNKFGKLWSQTIVATRLVITYFNWIGGIPDCRRPLPNGQD